MLAQREEREGPSGAVARAALVETSEIDDIGESAKLVTDHPISLTIKDTSEAPTEARAAGALQARHPRIGATAARREFAIGRSSNSPGMRLGLAWRCAGGCRAPSGFWLTGGGG
jgi:hypothetical protein